MGGEKVPALTVQQRLFADKWWTNGGDLIEAVTFAGYAGYPANKDKAKKGRQLLASRPVKIYVEYLRKKHVLDHKFRPVDHGVGKEYPDPTTSLHNVENSDSSNNCDNSSPVEQSKEADTVAGSGNDGKDNGVYVSKSVVGSGPEGVAVELPQELMSGILLPPSAGKRNVGPVPQYGTADRDEVRDFWTSVMRGQERDMTDGKIRMRASELLARNMGMLVELQITGTVGSDQTYANLTPNERLDEIAKIEAYLGKTKALLASDQATKQPEQDAEPVADSIQ